MKLPRTDRGRPRVDHTGCELLLRRVTAAYERRSIAIGCHSAFEH